MMPVPFRRVAITPSRAWHTPSALGKWGQQAVQRGADAFMLRPETPLPAEEANAPWAETLPVLLNCPAWPDALRRVLHFVAGLHLKSTAPWPLPTWAGSYAGLLGRSCHSLEDCLRAQAEGYHYVFLSPVFCTATHPEAPALGLSAFAAIVQQVQLPVFGLGGIGPSTEQAVWACGAHGMAAIGWFAD
jgi:thiamine monophosphate synthase